MPATSAVVSLWTLSGALPGSYRSSGARFDHVLFHAIDPERLLAWNVVTPESVPEHVARAPVVRSPGDLGALWGVQSVGPERKPGEPNDKAVKNRRTIVYMQKGKTVVMTIEEPAGK